MFGVQRLREILSRPLGDGCLIIHRTNLRKLLQYPAVLCVARTCHQSSAPATNVNTPKSFPEAAVGSGFALPNSFHRWLINSAVRAAGNLQFWVQIRHEEQEITQYSL